MGRESLHLLNHSKCLLAALQNFRQDETMLDVTLVCNNMSLKAHKLVLSACSPLFKEILSDNPCTHPIIILRDFEFADLKAVIEFIYKGEFIVPRERLLRALKVAEELQIRGLKRQSGPNREEKYEKLYNQVREKLSSRKKRKRRRHNSSDSEESSSVSESCQNVPESEISLSADEDEAPLESQSMEVEPVNEENSENSKDVRPIFFKVIDSSANNEEPTSKDAGREEEECSVINSVEESSLNEQSQNEDASLQKEENEDETGEPAPESAVTNSQFYSYSTCPENTDVSFVYSIDDQNSCQEQSVEVSDETKPQEEGKRFVCSKCDITFTSRISFMKHKTLGHNNTQKKNPYECKHCNFTTDELDCYKSHLLIHSDRVPYKCNTCPEEFTSEELYKKHMSLHEVEKISLQGLSSPPAQELFSTQNKNPETVTEFRCSICFIKFTSKLRCQIHEKTCQGENLKMPFM